MPELARLLRQSHLIGAASILLALILAVTTMAFTDPTLQPVVWAWERPEDLRFLETGVDVAVQSGFVVLTGSGVFARGRRFTLQTSRPPTVSVVHVQIDHHRQLAWTAGQRRETAEVVLGLGNSLKTQTLQIDFEVRRSERPILFDVLSDVRRLMPPTSTLSMTALASWCETETRLRGAPVDEIVPMLFRMGPEGQALKAKIEAGGDFANPRCRTALGVSVDTPLIRLPPHRRVYLFDPRSWTDRDYSVVRREMGRWSSRG